MTVPDVRAEICKCYVRNTLGRNVGCVILEMHMSVRLLTHWHTQPAVRRAEPSMPLLLILALSQ
jgi:hypothetical protein